MAKRARCTRLLESIFKAKRLCSITLQVTAVEHISAPVLASQAGVAGVFKLIVEMTVTDLSWLPAAGDDGEFASLPAAARSLLLAPGNASLAPESDWGLMLEGHSGVWLGPSPQQLSLPLLTSTRTLQATPPDVDSSKAAPGSCFLLYEHRAYFLAALDLPD